MNTLINKYDTLEAIIYNDGLSIHAIDFHQELDLMLIVLNTKAKLHQNISSYHSLKNSSLAQLKNYELIGKGTGVHWPDIDEDLSLKGFLRDEISYEYNSKTFNLADNFKKNILQKPGRENISDDADEVEYLAQALGLSRKKLISALKKIGASEVAVKKALKSKY